MCHILSAQGNFACNERGWKRWEEQYAFHRFCKRHLVSNVQKKFENVAVKNLFGKASEQTKIRKYNFYMDRLKEYNEDAYKYLVEGSIPERQWTLLHYGGHRYGVKTTNMSEEFNGNEGGLVSPNHFIG